MDSKLPKSIKGRTHLSIKKRGEVIQHPIRWNIDSEITKMSIYDGSKFEEVVDVLYKHVSKPYYDILEIMGEIYVDRNVTEDMRYKFFDEIKVLMRNNPKDQELVNHIRQNIYGGK